MMSSKLLALFIVATLISACRVGPQLDKTEIGQQPHGANVTVELISKGGNKRVEHIGELIDVRNDGLVIGIRSNKHDGIRLAFIPWDVIFVARPTDWPGYVVRHSHGEARRKESIRKQQNISRFPQGLSPELLKELLAHSGQTELETIE